MNITVHEGIVTAWLDAEPGEAWSELVNVYSGLGIDLGKLAVFDAAAHRIGVLDYRTSRLADERLSRFIRCGDSVGAPKADNGQVRLTINTWLEPHEGGANVSSTVSAWTRGVGTSAAPIQCASRGLLEREVIKRLHLALLDETG